MNCYSLIDGEIQGGISAASFMLSAEAPGDTIRQALIDLEVTPVVDAALKSTKMITCEEPFVFSYGVALLRPLDGLRGKPRHRALKRIEPLMPDGSLLVEIDLSHMYGDRALGDTSVLITWLGKRGLMLCMAGRTALRSSRSSRVFINRAGVLLEDLKPDARKTLHQYNSRQWRVAQGLTRIISSGGQD
jgi:hypothetical protein